MVPTINALAGLTFPFVIAQLLHLNPRIFPARNPPSAVLYASSFCRKFADANLVNSYAPPMPARASLVLLPQCSRIRDPTKYTNGSSSPSEYGHRIHVRLGERVLDSRDGQAGCTTDESAIDGGLDGVFRLVVLVPVGHGEGYCGIRTGNLFGP